MVAKALSDECNYTHKGCEAEEIYSIIKRVIEGPSAFCIGRAQGKAARIAICEALGQEVSQYKDERLSVVSYEIKQMLAKDSYEYKKDLVKVLKSYVPDIYNRIVGEEMGSIEAVLKCCDKEFANDCLQYADKERWRKEADEIDGEKLLLQVRKAYNDEVNEDCKFLPEIIATIQETTGAFSDDFICDFAVLSAIMQMRRLNIWKDKIYADRPKWIHYEDDIDKIFIDLFTLLYEYMPNKYSLSNLVRCLTGRYKGMLNNYYRKWQGAPIDAIVDTDFNVMNQMRKIAQKKGCELTMPDEDIDRIVADWKFSNKVKKVNKYDKKYLKEFRVWLVLNCRTDEEYEEM